MWIVRITSWIPVFLTAPDINPERILILVLILPGLCPIPCCVDPALCSQVRHLSLLIQPLQALGPRTQSNIDCPGRSKKGAGMG